MSQQTSKTIAWLTAILTFGILLLLLLGILSVSKFPSWIGTGMVVDSLGNVVSPQKTLWDLLDLIIIPVVLAIIAVLFNRQEAERTQKITEDKHQEEALQLLLEKLGQLLLNNDLQQADDKGPARTYARAITRTILHRVDGPRKQEVVVFLKEAGLIERDRTIISLAGADLRGVVLKKSHLKSKNFSKANLANACLNDSIFCDSNLSETNLTSTQLRNTDMKNVSFTNANLKNADLSGANLEGAKLTKADLRDAVLMGTCLDADLTGAKLQGARYNNKTVWPSDFDPEIMGAERVS